MKGRIILAVEDNQLNLKLVRALLRKDSFRFVEASNAERGSALARVGSQEIDLILLEIFLPGRDGFEVGHHPKENGPTKHI